MSFLLSRRDLVTGAAALVLCPQQSFSAEPDKIVNVGWLSSTLGPDPLLDAFRAGLHDLNYIDGQSIHIKARSAQDNADLRTLARELVRQQVDVFITNGRAATRAAQEATAMIPIVMHRSMIPMNLWPVSRGPVATSPDWRCNKRKSTPSKSKF